MNSIKDQSLSADAKVGCCRMHIQDSRNARKKENLYGSATSKVRKAGKASKAYAKKHTWKKPKGMPKRPLSAYNLFFKYEREKIVVAMAIAKGFDRHEVLNEVRNTSAEGVKKTRCCQRKSYGKVGFGTLAKTIAEKWNNLDDDAKIPFEDMARAEKETYKAKVDKWKKDQRLKKHEQADMLQESEKQLKDKIRVKSAIALSSNIKHNAITADKFQTSQQKKKDLQCSFSDIFLSVEHNGSNSSFDKTFSNNDTVLEEDILLPRSLSTLSFERLCSQGCIELSGSTSAVQYMDSVNIESKNIVPSSMLFSATHTQTGSSMISQQTLLQSSLLEPNPIHHNPGTLERPLSLDTLDSEELEFICRLATCDA
mmetsp:Transcript_4271/g.5567  ORF Transcript_4271/g.5567 Transcript_4271/m.5567 type:complete len:369 (+) Transcript_4271:151-1257(+)